MVCCLVLVAGCTSTPPAVPTGGANAVPIAGANVAPIAGAGAHAAAIAGTANAGTATNAATTDAAVRPVNRALVAQGYRPTAYRGQLFYCRKEKLTGSQFAQKVCLTEQEAALQERIAQDEMTKRNSAGKCLPPLCPKK
jgi:hypothetical protein